MRALNSSFLPLQVRALNSFCPEIHVQLLQASNLSGATADGLLKRGWRLGQVRKLMQTVAFVGPVAALLVLCMVPEEEGSTWLAVTLSCAALGCGAFSHSGFWSNVVDLSPQYSGVMLGISNTLGTVPGIMANLSTGYILQQTGNNWGWVFGLAIAIYCVGLIVFLTWSSADEQFR